jgi:phospholipase C
MQQLPALATLAKSFSICTRWHCSVPGATWPNRLFAHSGTSDNTVDIEPGLYENGTIFDRLNEVSEGWHIYHDPSSLPQVAVFSRLTDPDNVKNWYALSDFARHVENEKLPAYSFIEPRHDGPVSNSQHPGNNDYRRLPDKDGLTDFQRGERLIAWIYETLRNKPQVFNKTIFIITYDEHGGFYDHVPPPTNAVAPTPIDMPQRKSDWPLFVGWFIEQPTSHFKFTVLGPRVPAVVVSPLIKPQVDRTIYDHSAIPATVRKLFAPTTKPLSEREAKSPTLEHLWNERTVRGDLPDLSTIAQGIPGAGPPQVSLLEVTIQRRDDEFARQLSDLAARVAPKVTRKSRVSFRQGGRPEGESPSGGAASLGVGSDLDASSPESIAAALLARAREARGE